jgi:hypothetical protein
VTAARHRCIDGAAHLPLDLARELPAVNECCDAVPAVKMGETQAKSEPYMSNLM